MRKKLEFRMDLLQDVKNRIAAVVVTEFKNKIFMQNMRWQGKKKKGRRQTKD